MSVKEFDRVLVR